MTFITIALPDSRLRLVQTLLWFTVKSITDKLVVSMFMRMVKGNLLKTRSTQITSRACGLRQIVTRLFVEMRFIMDTKEVSTFLERVEA